VVEASGLHAGEVFYAREDTEVVKDRVRLALLEAGWPESQVDVSVDVGVEPVASIQISLGAPSEVGEVRLGGTLVLPTRRLERVLRRVGLSTGELLDARAVREGQGALRELLVDRGWLQARVNILLLPGSQADRTDVEVVIEAGPRLTIDARGMRRMSDAEIRELIGLYAGDRVDEGLAERATEDLLAWWDRQGFMDARVAVTLTPREGDHLLSVRAQRGPRHVLSRVEVDGAEVIASAFLVGAMKEADPEGLGANVVSRAGLDDALVGVEQLYRGRGHLSAEPRFEGLDELPQGPLSRLLRRQPTAVRIALDEGPVTRLETLDVVGAGSLVEDLVAEETKRLVGQAYSVANLERLAGRIAEAYRAEGHLDADVAVEPRLDPRERTAHAVLRVEPVASCGSEASSSRAIERLGVLSSTGGSRGGSAALSTPRTCRRPAPSSTNWTSSAWSPSISLAKGTASEICSSVSKRSRTSSWRRAAASRRTSACGSPRRPCTATSLDGATV